MEHNFHYTPGLLLSKVADPVAYVQSKQRAFDEVFAKQFVVGKDLTAGKESSGIAGLDAAGHNVGCVEPHNITVNTRKLGGSLRDYLWKGNKDSCRR